MLRKRHYLQNQKTGFFEGSSSGGGEGSGGLRANDSSRSGGGSGTAGKAAKGVLDKVDKAVDAVRDRIRKGTDSAGNEAKAIGEAGKKTLDKIGEAAKAPGNVAESIRIFKEEKDNMDALSAQNKLEPQQDKFFHLKANCRAARLGPGGEAAAKVLSEGKEFYDVTTGKNTREESAADMRANEAGRRADTSKSCNDAANEYWKNVPKEKNSGKVISEKTFDLFGTRKKGR
jgi:hypothetical protein